MKQRMMLVISRVCLLALLALALLPTTALADEEVWFGQGEEPLGASAEEVPEGATVITSITVADYNTTLVPGQMYWFGGRVTSTTPSAPVTMTRSVVVIPGPGIPLLMAAPGTVHDFPLPEPGEYPPEVCMGMTVTFPEGYTISSDVTISYLGKTYKNNDVYVYQGENKADITVGSLRFKLAYPAPLYRMYNTKTSEHLWTKSKKEYESAGSGSYADWKAEGVAWYVPTSSSKPVYRLYNTKSGDHHYTTSATEKAKLVDSGQWRDEGIAFYSATAKDTNTIKVYRVYNSRLKRGQHHYTKSAAERDSLVKNSGWKDEGVGFYGYSSAKPKAETPTH